MVVEAVGSSVVEDTVLGVAVVAEVVLVGVVDVVVDDACKLLLS
jgi:hypothetical protein